MNGWEQLLTGHQPAVTGAQLEGVYEGRVLAISGTEATFVIPDFHPNLRFGPGPFGRTTAPPQVGDICLVAFVRGDVDRPWLLRWRAPD
jgi:hypothetical protein